MASTTLAPPSPELLPSTWADASGGEHVEFRILGPVGARYDGQELSLGGAKPLTVLAVLLVERGVVHDSRLISLLWGSNPPRTVGAQLYTYVSRLRKSLPDAIKFSRIGQGYSVEIGSARFDYNDFCRLSDLGTMHLNSSNYRWAAEYLSAALDLWSGPALSNVTEYLSDEQAIGLEERRLTALERRIDADLALGREEQLVGELHVLTAQHPLREAFRDKLMRALFWCGRQSEAIRVYHDGRRLLAEELGLDPDFRLQETFSAILSGGATLQRAGKGRSRNADHDRVAAR